MTHHRFGHRHAKAEAKAEAKRKAERAGPGVLGPNGQPFTDADQTNLGELPDQSICPVMSSFVSVAMPDPKMREFTKSSGPGVMPCLRDKCAWWSPEANPGGPVFDGCIVTRFCRGMAPVIDHMDDCVDDLVIAAQNAGALPKPTEAVDDGDASGDAPAAAAAPRDPEPEVYE